MKTSVVFLCALLLAGCQHSGIKVTVLQTNKSVFFSGNSGYFDDLIQMPPESKSVYFLCREGDLIKMEKRDIAGVLIQTHEIPLFSEWYGAVPYALATDASKIAYNKDRTKSIFIYDLVSKTEYVLCEDIVSNRYNIKGLIWISDKELIILLDNDIFVGRKFGELIKVDVSIKKITSRLELSDPTAYSFCSSRMLLAVAREVRGSGIKIIDVSRMTVVSEIPNSNSLAWMNVPAWNPDGTKLAYVDGNDNFCNYDFQRKEVTIIKSLPKKDVAYSVAYPNEGICVLYHGVAGGKSTIDFFELKSKRIVRSISDSWGKAVFLDGGKAIAYEK